MLLPTVKEEEAYYVDQKSQTTHYDQQFGIVDGVSLDEPFASFDRDGEAESHEKDGVDQSSEDFGSRPAERVFRPFFGRHLP